MRRLPSVLLLGALALATTAFAPAVTANQTTEASEQPVICVRFRDWTVPVIGYTYEPPAERFCIETRDVVVPVPGGNPMPGTLPGPGSLE